MAFNAHILCPPRTLLFPIKIQPLSKPAPTLFSYKQKPQIQHCTKRNSAASGRLAAELASEVAKLSTQLAQKEEAMRKSKQFLFSELCSHLGQEAEQVKANWWVMGEEEKWVLVRGFVAKLGFNFQPLSVRSATELIEEYLNDVKKPPPLDDDDDDDHKTDVSFASAMFPVLKRLIMGFTD